MSKSYRKSRRISRRRISRRRSTKNHPRRKSHKKRYSRKSHKKRYSRKSRKSRKSYKASKRRRSRKSRKSRRSRKRGGSVIDAVRDSGRAFVSRLQRDRAMKEMGRYQAKIDKLNRKFNSGNRHMQGHMQSQYMPRMQGQYMSSMY